MVGEATVSMILERAENLGIQVRIIPGISFIEPVLAALKIDALNGLQLYDGLQIASYLQPPLNVDFPVLIGQVYNRLVASELKITLMAMYPEDHQVYLIHSAGMDDQVLESLSLFEIDRSERLAHLSSLFVPPLEYHGSLQSFAETVAYLRSPDGCPWDQEQTRKSLRADFLEEAVEALKAMDDDDSLALQEELGDVLYHLVMQAQIASEYGEFSLSDVIAGIEAKLRHRHPHVWGKLQLDSSQDVMANWEKIKSEEYRSRNGVGSILGDIPGSLPALAGSQKIQGRVTSVGFDWPSLDGVISKINEELSELGAEEEIERISSELGDVLFAMVNLARWHGVDAETALREANTRFVRRFRELERLAASRDLGLVDLELNELDALWEEAKTATDLK